MCNLPASTVSNASSWTRCLTAGQIAKALPWRQRWTRATGRDMVESLEVTRAERCGESCWERGRTRPESATLVYLVPVRCDRTGHGQRRTTMPVIKVTDMAYGKLRSPDLDAQEEFLTHFGMVRAERTKN